MNFTQKSDSKENLLGKVGCLEVESKNDSLKISLYFHDIVLSNNCRGNKKNK